MKKPALALALVFANGSMLLSWAQDEPARTLPAHRTVDADHFATSSRCAMCHSNAPQAQGLRDAKGRGIAPFDLWRSTMMANSARDPLWRAVVSAEVAATPSRKVAIEAKCLRCHSPMASTQALLKKEGPIGLALLHGESDESQLALDGVSCTVCHQIQPGNLGTDASYSGNYKIGTDKQIFGPHEEPIGMPMMRHTGFTPVQANHVRDSAMCATCHTLFTHAFDAEGKLTGETLPEQTPYLEWRNSVFNDEIEDLDHRAQSCQDCHMPIRDADGELIEARIARNPMGGDFRMAARSPFGRHVFVGGNTLMLSILRDNADVLQPQAPKEAFDASIAMATEQLQTRTAHLSLGEIARSEDRLQIPVKVENRTGHKFPTGHPTRRAWLRVRVRDGVGEVLFASGEHDAAGRIVGADGKLLPEESKGGPTHGHHATVTSAAQVQVYEAIMADAGGKPTYLLTRGGRFLKDNRLLPLGWRPDHPAVKDTAPQGVGEDADFSGGADALIYDVPLPKGSGAVTVEVSLLYQVLGVRYADEVLVYDTPEIREFRRFYEAADRAPLVVAKVEKSSE